MTDVRAPRRAEAIGATHEDCLRLADHRATIGDRYAELVREQGLRSHRSIVAPPPRKRQGPVNGAGGRPPI